MIGENLKKIRKHLGLNQADFANRIGITGGYVSDIERRNLVPSEPVLRSLELAFKINRKFLLTGTGEMLIGDEEQKIVMTIEPGPTRKKASKTKEQQARQETEARISLTRRTRKAKITVMRTRKI